MKNLKSVILCSLALSVTASLAETTAEGRTSGPSPVPQATQPSLQILHGTTHDVQKTLEVQNAQGEKVSVRLLVKKAEEEAPLNRDTLIRVQLRCNKDGVETLATAFRIEDVCALEKLSYDSLTDSLLVEYSYPRLNRGVGVLKCDNIPEPKVIPLKCPTEVRKKVERKRAK